MLVLGRKEGERIVITDERTGERVCEVLVPRIKAGSVEIAFDAPLHFNIVRKELADK